MSRIGEFTEPVRIEAPNPVATGSGATRDEWRTPIFVMERWARIRNGDSREVFAARQRSPEVDAVISLVGCYEDVTTRMRVVHEDGRKWDITGVVPRGAAAPSDSDIVDLHCVLGKRAGS